MRNSFDIVLTLTAWMGGRRAAGFGFSDGSIAAPSLDASPDALPLQPLSAGDADAAAASGARFERQ